jgi:hypothetical protein
MYIQKKRWLAFGVRNYFKDGWSLLDFLIVFVSFIRRIRKRSTFLKWIFLKNILLFKKK